MGDGGIQKCSLKDLPVNHVNLIKIMSISKLRKDYVLIMCCHGYRGDILPGGVADEQDPRFPIGWKS